MLSHQNEDIQIQSLSSNQNILEGHHDQSSQDSFELTNQNIAKCKIKSKNYSGDSFQFQTNNSFNQRSEQQITEIRGKMTIVDKIKAYLGFGQFVTNQSIGSIFLIPIPRKWKLVYQILAMQFLIFVCSYSVYFIIRFSGLDIAQGIQEDWLRSQFETLNFEKLRKVNAYCRDLLNISIDQDVQMLNFMSSLVVNQLDENRPSILVMENETMQEMSRGSETNTNFSQVDYNTTSYFYLDQRESPHNHEQLLTYSSINVILPRYYPNDDNIFARMFWMFDEPKIAITYPGLQLEKELANEYQRYMEDQFQLILNFFKKNKGATHHVIPFYYDQYYGSYMMMYSVKILNGGILLGIAGVLVDSRLLMGLFEKVTESDIHPTHLLFIDKQGLIMTDGYFPQLDRLDEHISLNLSQIHSINYVNAHTPNKKDVPITYLIDEFKEFGLEIIFFYESDTIKDFLDETQQQFQLIQDKFVSFYAPILVFVTLLLLGVSTFIIYHWISQINSVTEQANQTLKKTSKVDNLELQKVKGERLIQQLIDLFLKLVNDLHSLKNSNKNQIAQHYHQQRYPLHFQEANTDEIARQVEQLKEKVMQEDPLSQTRNMNLIPKTYDDQLKE